MLGWYFMVNDMSRARMSKVDMLARAYKLKNELYDGTYHDKSAEWHDGAHNALNRVLDILNEYSS